jgi:acyl carrier protein
MVHDSVSLILETIAASMCSVGRLGNTQVLAGDTLKDLGLSRLRLLAVLIDLEDKFAIEFPADAIDGLRNVDDLTFYIHSHATTPYDDAADEQPVASCHPIERRLSICDCVHWVCAQAFPRDRIA